MRKVTAVAAMVVALAGCGTFKKTFGIKDAPPAHREPRSTSIYGDWVLANPDSTAFAGASLVELSLHESNFTIDATYPGRSPVRISGTAAYGEGLLTLTPTGGSADMGALATAFATGRPIAVVASAAGGSLVFAPPPTGGTTAVVPSSVWHKKSQAEAAGKVTP
ncbi:MAG TPA: hypothetical protein VHM30_04650 [Gemmatimonadaceae bacterium]|nr:hypothetical protein [Gemmatimonadaceae bacterium]